MDQLPVEIQEHILYNFIHWENIKDLYRARAVSKSWKSLIDTFTSRLFQVWYNRCKKEIPEDHLIDIVQAKYPLVAQPWQKYYWVNFAMPHVAKNVYDIWRSLPNVYDNKFCTSPSINRMMDIYNNHSTKCRIAGVSDKYLAVSCRENHGREFSEIKVWVYRWDNLRQHICQYNLGRKNVMDEVNFYSTERGTSIVIEYQTLRSSDNHISIYPIDNKYFPSSSISLRYYDQYVITQNQCFRITRDNSTHLKILEHKILTERGFENNTIIELPTGIFNWENTKIVICGCTLYVLTHDWPKWSIIKYKIFRNFKGKLLFSFKELKVLDDDKNLGSNDELYRRKYYFLFRHNCRCNKDSHPADFAFALTQFQSWLSRVLKENIRPLAVHANYVIFVKTQIADELCIFQKDNLIECMKVDNPDNLKYTFISLGNSQELLKIHCIRIIYIGSKAKLLVCCYGTMRLIDFY